jgi:Uma2 family endonuclease
MDASFTEVIRPLRRIEYDRLVGWGVFEDERVELLDGELVAMSPIGEPHNHAVRVLNEVLVLALHGRAWIRPQMSFVADDLSQPEPDLAIVPPSDRTGERPTKALLIIEVSESSLRYDRVRKQRVYARSGVPEYWIVNIPERCIETYAEPHGDSYARSARYEVGQTLRIEAFPEVEIAVSDVLK